MMSLSNEEVRLMRERYADYLQNIENKPRWHRKIMDIHWRLRSKVYALLEKPKTPLSVCYHIAIFVYILFVHTSGALISHELHTEVHMDFMTKLEKTLAVYFFIEFLLRIWSAGADGRFQGWAGRKRFLCQPMCVMDMVVLSLAITVILLAEYRYSGRLLDVLRFIQILRFLHIDRQMVSWTLLRKLVVRSRFELITIYYVTICIFVLMAYLVFTLEGSASQGGMRSDVENATFSNYGEAFWFSAVSIFTIGYGDFIPKHPLTKLVTCIFSYTGLCLFGAASTLAGVGLSLMLDHRNKQQKQTKVRNLAASLIQVWYRFHLISNDRTFRDVPVYSQICARLNLIEEKMLRQRQMAKRNSELGFLRLGANQVKQPKARAKKKFFVNPIATNNITISSEFDMSNALRVNVTPAIFISSTEMNEELDEECTQSLPRAETHSELQLLAKKIAENQRRRGSATVIPIEKKASPLVRFLQWRNAANSSPKSSQILHREESKSFDSGGSDAAESRDLDYYSMGDEHSVNSALTISENMSLASSGMPVLTGKHRAILRLIYYLRFMVLRKRFKRARMPYELDDAEAELCELEHRRMYAFKQLEKQYNRLVGKQKLARNDSSEDQADLIMKSTIISRLDDYEARLGRLTGQVHKLEQTLLSLATMLQQNANNDHNVRDFLDSNTLNHQ